MTAILKQVFAWRPRSASPKQHTTASGIHMKHQPDPLLPDSPFQSFKRLIGKFEEMERNGRR